MSVSVVANDIRLVGRTPLSAPSFMSLDVDEGTPLDFFFNRCRQLADQRGGIATLFIMAQPADTAFADASNGNGIIFCQELVHLNNIHRFAGLAEHVEHIVLLIFAPAATSFDIEVMKLGDPEMSASFHGDGDELSRQLAIHTKAKVTVAREGRPYFAAEHCTAFAGSDIYCEGGYVDFGDWEGSIARYDEDGRIFEEWTNHGAWRDSDGIIPDPRLGSR